MSYLYPFPFTVEVQITNPYVIENNDMANEVTQWAETNCKRLWILDSGIAFSNVWYLRFKFQDKQDAMFFKMRWQ